MSKVKIQGNASGTGVVTLTAPNTNTDRTITLPDETVSLTGAPAGLDDVGGVARATSGLLFNADTAAANALDDYEEGTWTASLTGNGSAPSTAATATGTYTKIGRQVTVHVYLANKNTSGASGEMNITGLPFNPSQSTVGTYASYGLEAQGSFCVAYARTSGTVEFLEMNDGAVWGAVQIVAGSSKYLDLAMTYET